MECSTVNSTWDSVHVRCRPAEEDRLQVEVRIHLCLCLCLCLLPCPGSGGGAVQVYCSVEPGTEPGPATQVPRKPY